LDIAPSAAGVVVGITNTFGSVAGVVAPWAMGFLTTYPEGKSRER
jgi:nitrate/nitrite transporter NarK